MIVPRCFFALLTLTSVFPLSKTLASEPTQESRETQRAHLKVQFLFDGPSPIRPKIEGTKEALSAECEILSESLIVNEKRQIQNVVMYLDTRRTKMELPDFSQRKPAKHVLEARDCRFVPHILSTMAGDTIVEKNSDKIGHNANFSWFNDPTSGPLILIGCERKQVLRKAEPVPIPIECDIHPWMKAYIVVLAHPYVGISNESGIIEIQDLPVGKLTFRLWHEHSVKSMDWGELDGKSASWPKGRIEVDLKPGMNDLGKITFNAEKFKSTIDARVKP